jgi:hypothetical protein
MAKTSMPSQGLKHHGCCKADRVHRAELKVVQPVQRALHLHNQTAAMILDGEDSTANADVVPALVELPEAHNIAL